MTLNLTLSNPGLRALPWQRMSNAVTNGLMTPSEAVAKHGIEYGEQPVYINGPTQSPFHGPTPIAVPKHKAITMNGQPIEVVSSGYQLITPQQLAEVLDTTGKPVRSFFSINGGKTVGFAFDMGEYEVKDLAINSHFMVYNGMTGSRALGAFLADSVMVCTNGLISIRNERGGKIAHNRNAMEYLKEWVKYLIPGYEIMHNEQVDQLNALASLELVPEDAITLVNQVYPMPKKPSDFGPKLIVSRNMQQYETRRDETEQLRKAAKFMWWNSDYQGSELVANHMTALGLVNVIAELEDHRPGRLVGQSIILGERAERKRTAMAAALSLVN